MSKSKLDFFFFFFNYLKTICVDEVRATLSLVQANGKDERGIGKEESY